jgi:hypothetical protein
VFKSWNLTIQGLKQLTNNSIQYSGMSAAEKAQAFTYWQDQVLLSVCSSTNSELVEQMGTVDSR